MGLTYNLARNLLKMRKKKKKQKQTKLLFGGGVKEEKEEEEEGEEDGGAWGLFEREAEEKYDLSVETLEKLSHLVRPYPAEFAKQFEEGKGE